MTADPSVEPEPAIGGAPPLGAGRLAEERTPEKEQQILRGAALVFTQDGYEGASMSRIARAAGVSKGTLYNYFSSKYELFAAHIRLICAERLAHVFNDIPMEGPAEEILRLTARRMLELFLSDTGLAIHRLVISEAVKFPELGAAFLQAGPHVALARITRLISAQAEAGNLEVADARIAAQHLVALVQTAPLLHRQLNQTDHVPEDEIVRMVDGAVRLFMRGYAPAGGRAE